MEELRELKSIHEEGLIDEITFQVFSSFWFIHSYFNPEC